MKFLSDYNKIQSIIKWIDDTKDENANTNSVGKVIPQNYEYYFKLYFPLSIEDINGNIKRIKYNEIAKLAKTEYSSSFSWMSLPTNLKVKTVNEFSEIINFIKSLSEILGKDTNCVFYGFGDDILPDKFMNSWIQEGIVSEFLNLTKELNEEIEDEIQIIPNYIFAKDKSWCTGTMIHPTEIVLLGCNKKIATKIRSQNEIDYQEIKFSDTYVEFRRRKYK